MHARGFGAYIGRWYASGYGDRDLGLNHPGGIIPPPLIVRSLPLASTIPAKLTALAVIE